jgi:hypothetical protein
MTMRTMIWMRHRLKKTNRSKKMKRKKKKKKSNLKPLVASQPPQLQPMVVVVHVAAEQRLRQYPHGNVNLR